MKLLQMLAFATLIPSAYAATPISKYMGDWVDGKKYKPGQVVSYQEKSWLCVDKCRINVPGTNQNAWVTLGSNVTGPQGPKGDTGAQGQQGVQGVQGLAGPQGAEGPQGSTGPMGPIGVAGANGAQGPQGQKGDSGERGPVGPVGPQGPMGMTGVQGVAGPKGDRGAQGPQGPAGTSGGIKVYDANNQFLGFHFDNAYNVLIPYTGYYAKFLRVDPCLGKETGPVTAWIGGDCSYSEHHADVPVYHLTSDCSGIGVEGIYGLDTNEVIRYDTKYGRLEAGQIYPASSVKSVKGNNYQCAQPGGYSQSKPTPQEICSTSFPVTFTVAFPASGNACTDAGLASPCYSCNGSTTADKPVGAYFTHYTFEEVTLPFTLPVALPLRYEVAQ